MRACVVQEVPPHESLRWHGFLIPVAIGLRDASRRFGEGNVYNAEYRADVGRGEGGGRENMTTLFLNDQIT